MDSHFGLLRPDIHGIVGTFRDEFCKPFKRQLHTIKNESRVGNSEAFGTGRYLRKKRIGNMVLHMYKVMAKPEAKATCVRIALSPLFNS